MDYDIIVEMGKNGSKIATSLVMLALAISVIFTQVGSQLFPGLAVGMFVVTAGLLIAVFFTDLENDQWWLTLLFLIVVASMTYKTYVYLFPSFGVVGYDPGWYVSMISAVSSTGTTGSIQSSFYPNAPLFFILGSSVTLITKVDPEFAMAVYPLLAGLMLPLAAVLTCRTVFPERRSALLIAALLSSVASVSTKFGYWPFAQTLAVIFWVLFIYLLFARQYIQTKAIILLIVVAMMFVHKLSLIILTVTLVGIAAVEWIAPAHVATSAPKRTTFNLLLIVGALLSFQWLYLTDFISRGFILLTHLIPGSREGTGQFKGTGNSVGGMKLHDLESHAVVVEPLVTYAAYYLHAFILMGFAGIAWVILFKKYWKNDRTIVSFLVLVAINVALIVFAFYEPTSAVPFRFLFFVEAFLCILVGVCYTSHRDGYEFLPPVPAYIGGKFSDVLSTLSDRFGSSRDRPYHLGLSLPNGRGFVGLAIIFLILFSQIFSVVALPDGPFQERQYLHPDEGHARQFGAEYMSASIFTDHFYANKPPIRYPLEMTRQFKSYDRDLIQREVRPSTHGDVLYRTKIDYHRVDGKMWTLRWSPEAEFDSTYSRIYDSGGSIGYTNIG